MHTSWAAPGMRYNVSVDARSPSMLNYAQPCRVMPTRHQVGIVALALLVPVSVVGLPIFGNWYAWNRYPGVTAGITRAQVDRHLWSFTTSPSTYNAMELTDLAVEYEFLGLGKWAEIKIIFDANGVVVSAIPSFNN
jgi:hypothetical protein